MIHTEICDLLGIEYPIFQGGMAWVSDASLAGAVSNAGGLGIIAGMNSNGEQLREQIRKIREITNKPYGVNVMLMSPYADEVAQVVVEEKVPVVVTGAGLPSKYIKTWVENGLKVVPVVPSVAIARMCERMGACAVVAEGGESGGHVGDLTTMALTPQVVDAVKIPVLAAGGIGDDVHVRDVLIAMGASTNSHFADQYRFPGQLCATADFGLLRTAVETAEKMGVRADVGQVFTSDQFYNDNPDAGETYRKFGILGVEMETAGLYWQAQRFGKRALSLLTVSDHLFTGESLPAQERQDSFHEMMEIALETAWKSLEG